MLEHLVKEIVAQHYHLFGLDEFIVDTITENLVIIRTEYDNKINSDVNILRRALEEKFPNHEVIIRFDIYRPWNE